MNTIRAKVKVDSVEESHYGPDGAKSSENVHMSPVYSSDPTSENYSFSQATPGGSFQLFITNPSAFGFYEQGKEYMVDFVPADATSNEAPQIDATKPKETEFLLQYFVWEHLPVHLQAVSRPFGEMANHIVNTLPRNPERTVSLRKLLEAKDCAVRALIAK